MDSACRSLHTGSPEFIREAARSSAEFLIPHFVSREHFLSTRETEVLLIVACYRYLSRHQLERFLFDRSELRAPSRNTVGWRVVQRLVTKGLLSKTQRLVGGPTGGSNGLAYFLTKAGYRHAASLNPSLPPRRLPSSVRFLMGAS